MSVDPDDYEGKNVLIIGRGILFSNQLQMIYLRISWNEELCTASKLFMEYINPFIHVKRKRKTIFSIKTILVILFILINKLFREFQSMN